MNKNSVFNTLNVIFFVLCLNIIIPRMAPILPPRKDIVNSNDSGILQAFFMALYLSRPYKMNAIKLVIIK